ncbi:MAG: hypothetical protein Q8S41_11865 [Lutibacter sp.]|nr:hypothetical protein [Lutibacter sp.]
MAIQANDFFKEIPLEPINTFDEVPVEIIVKGYLRFEADVIITDKQLVYVNVAELFKNLGILCVVENNGNILKGFIENESIRYVIDFDAKQIIRGDRNIKSDNGIVKELGAIYVETGIINEAFGLNMLFNFRSLTIKLDADFELPMVKQARLEKMRQNISKLQSKNETVIDTVIGRNYHLFNGGAMDWSVSSNQAEGEKINNRFSLGLGSELLYGEAKVAFNYYDQTKFDKRQLYYNWRWVDNDNKYIKQAQVGKIGAQSIAFLGAPVVGASFNNSPNTVRKATGTYTISEYTEPNWTVELYINDALVDYTQADASGLYIFKVPIVYGYTTLKLKFYGPLGEERIEEKTMNTPYTFMPAGVLEYNVSGGILEDDESSNFGRGEVNFGINRFVTIGGGMEYLSSIADNPLIPFANVAFQPFTKMVVNMEYAHNVSLKGLLNYYFGRSAFLEIDYSKYVEGQEATLNKTNEERKARLSLPFKISRISATTKLSFNQYVYDAFNFNQVDALISGRYKNYSANASVASNWINNKDPFMTSTVVLSGKMRNGLTIRPSLQYNITENNMMRIRAEVEKRVTKMSFSASYERNIQYGTDNLFFSFKYDLPYARTGFSSSYYNNRFSFSESAQGSLAFGAGNELVHLGNNSALGKGGILLYPFLDINQNGIMDTNEPMVKLSKVRVSGGKATYNNKDFVVKIPDLNAFINYNIEFSDTDLDNISWQFKHKTYQVLIDPNQYKKVEIPILVMGEVNGMVAMQTNIDKAGQGRITLHIVDQKGNKVAETLSESDGYFSYLGLKPGNYSVKIDPEQLRKLNYQSSPKNQTFTIEKSEEGTIINGISFVLKALESESEKDLHKTEAIEDKADENVIDLMPQGKNADPSFGRISEINGSFFTVQIGVYKEPKTKKQLNNLSPVFYEALPNGTIRYVYGTFDNIDAANNAKNGLIFKNIKGAFVISYNNGEMVSPKDLVTKILIEMPTDSLVSKQRLGWTVNRNVNTNYTRAFDIKELFYTVQIGAFKNYVTSAQLQYLSPIFYEVIPNGNVRYVFGKFDTQKDAKAGKNKAIGKGIKDAFVVAYKNGEQVNAYSLKKVKVTDKGNSEVYGTVNMKIQNEIETVKNINLFLFNQNGFMVGATSTDEKGGYYFANLIPGNYSIRIDTNHLEDFNYEAVPAIHHIKIKETKEIGVLKGLDFTVTKLNKK